MTIHAKIYEGTLETLFSDQRYGRCRSFSKSLKDFISVSFSIASYTQEMRKPLSLLNRKRKQFKETKTLISNS